MDNQTRNHLNLQKHIADQDHIIRVRNAEITALRKRTEKAEQERDEARREARGWHQDALTEVQNHRIVQDELDRLRTGPPRPLTPDDITDEMVKRAAHCMAMQQMPTTYSLEPNGTADKFYDDAREVLHAALTEPPARPEGAEEWREELDEMPAVQDLTPGQRDRLADALAERDHALGVRVVTEEMNR